MISFRRIFLWRLFLVFISLNTIVIYFRYRFASLDQTVSIYDEQNEQDTIELPKKQIDKNIIRVRNNLLKQVNKINLEQRIHNMHLPDTIAVIVIQVHNKLFYLEQLIGSLKNMKKVNKTLLILSHSYYDENIMEYISKIKFVKVMQIFFPYSAQLHPKVFPGNDEKICTNYSKCEKKFRNAVILQHKHHWWWKANFVFDKLLITKNYTGPFIFLEEDRYVTNNLLRVLKILEKFITTEKIKCDIISFGVDDPKLSVYNGNKSFAVIKPWGVADYIGIAFNKRAWIVMKELSFHYCYFNDFEWYNSLWNLSKYTAQKHFTVISVIDARVFRFDRCSNNKIFCDEGEKVEYVQSFVNEIENLTNTHTWIVKKEHKMSHTIVINGGWDDVRDQELCMFYTK